VGLTWNVPNDGGVKIDGYFYEYKRSEDSAYSAFMQPITGTKVTITELVAEQTYDFRV
jgi:dihydroxyacetone kinase-like predicted kinase